MTQCIKLICSAEQKTEVRARASLSVMSLFRVKHGQAVLSKFDPEQKKKQMEAQIQKHFYCSSESSTFVTFFSTGK